MIMKMLFFIATLCIVVASANAIKDSEYDGDGLSLSADAVNDEPGNLDLNLNEDVEDPFMGGAGLQLDSVNLPNEERIRICSSSICNRACRVLKLRGKCVKKRCRCRLPRALSMLEEAGLMVGEEVENPNLINEE